MNAGAWRVIVMWCLMFAGLWGPPETAQAEPVSPEVGWWWSGRPTEKLPLVLPPVPPVAPGGYYVAEDLRGPSGVSALRFELGSDNVAVALTLAVADSIGTPVVVACPPLEPWEPVEGGPWPERAVPDCDTFSATGATADGGRSITFDLIGLGAKGVLDLVLIPGDAGAPDGERARGFSALFEPPSVGAVSVGRSPSRRPATGSSLMAGPEGEPTAPNGSDKPLSMTAPPAFVAPEPAQGRAPVERGMPKRHVQSSPAPVASAPTDTTQEFAYPSVLLLPLLLITLGSYLAHSLTKPVCLVGPRGGTDV